MKKVAMSDRKLNVVCCKLYVAFEALMSKAAVGECSGELHKVSLQNILGSKRPCNVSYKIVFLALGTFSNIPSHDYYYKVSIALFEKKMLQRNEKI